MDGILNIRNSFLEAAALGLLATATLYIAPLQAGNLLDRWLFDVWSYLSPAESPPADIVVVNLEDPSTIDEVVRVARAAGARLLISTQRHAPALQDDDLAIGPVELRVGAARVAHTEWRDGGHLRFEPDMDGVVRNDVPFAIESVEVPSLALRAAERLSGKSAATVLQSNADQRRWLRFYERDAFPQLSAASVIADPSLVRDKVVIAGGSERSELTPLGLVGTNVLLAHAVAGYLQGLSIESGASATAAAWLLAAGIIGVLGLLRAPNRQIAWFVLAASALGVLLAAGTAFSASDLWLPIVGPLAWLLLSGSLLAVRTPRAARHRRTEGDLPTARAAVARGDLTAAWSRYKQISPSQDLLPELYDLASQLDLAGNDRYAADVFHRVAQIDGNFRDVARRLVRSSQPQSAGGPLSREGMPDKMGRYELLEPIGRGAMGQVYLGRDPKINRIVALKAVNLAAEVEPAELEEASRNFLREAEIAGRLSHPNIVTIYDVGETQGLAYIAMEYLKGRHLSEFAVPERLLPPKTVLDLLSRTADALDYAHGQNVVHRDIKPANIMYDSIADGLKITDFGIARLIDVARTRTGIVLGTPAFMSPEQLEGKNVNGHTDLFALGVSLYQLLTGQLPFRGASMTKLMFVIANEPHESVTAVRPDLPTSLNPIIDKALAKDPFDRFQSGAEMAAAMRIAAHAA